MFALYRCVYLKFIKNKKIPPELQSSGDGTRYDIGPVSSFRNLQERYTPYLQEQDQTELFISPHYNDVR